MSEIITIELNRLAESVGVPSSLFTPPIPNAKPMVQYAWDGTTVEKAAQVLRQTYPNPGTQLAFLGHVDVWICLALAYAVEDTSRCYFASPNHDENNTFTYVPLDLLPIGTPSDEVYFSYSIRDEGEYVYMDYNVDDPAVQGHSFFHDSIGKLVLPEIPAGKTLCLYGSGIYPVQWAVTNTYKQISANVFTATHQDREYTCAWSGDGTYSVGDKLPRQAAE